MGFEEDEETYEWRDVDDDTHVPPALKSKWRRDEREGLRAGVCRSCGYPFTQEDLSCAHCGAPIEIPRGTVDSFRHFFFRTPMGILLLIGIFAALLAYLAAL